MLGSDTELEIAKIAVRLGMERAAQECEAQGNAQALQTDWDAGYVFASSCAAIRIRAIEGEA